MKLVTEQDLRAQIGGKEVDRYVVDRDTIVTPSARQYLSDRRIQLVVESPKVDLPAGEEEGPREVLRAALPAPFVGPDGGAFREKPEHMTHLKGNRLVPKGHPVIAFRGKLDTLQARIVALQARAAEVGREDLAEELEDFLGLVRGLVSAEVMGSPVEEIPLMGMEWDQIRRMSHNPRKHFGIGHIRAHYSMGSICAELNLLRALAREAELAAFKAFNREEGPSRPDVIRALNRLSSAFYVMMYRNLPKGYDKEY